MLTSTGVGREKIYVQVQPRTLSGKAETTSSPVLLKEKVGRSLTAIISGMRAVIA